MSSRNPPENSHEEHAGQAGGRLRGVFESRLASQRKFFASPSTAPAPSSSPENPEDLEGQAGRAKIAEGLRTSPQIQSAGPKAIPASKHAIIPEESSPGTVPPANLAPSEVVTPQVRVEESSVSIAATGEEITNPEEQPPKAAPKTEFFESRPHHTVAVERRGSYRYKVERIQVLLGWRQGENDVSTDSPGLSGELAMKPPSGVGLAGKSLGGTGTMAVRDPETASLSADFDHHEALVHDISLTGLCLIVDRLPPINRNLCVGMMGTRPIVWSPVVLRSLSEPHPGRFLLRLSFKESCPYDLFKLAVMQMADARKVT